MSKSLPDYSTESVTQVIAVNGSPRKKGNTYELLEEALCGARSQGAETALLHLQDISFRGCQSCFECKRVGGSSYGHCAFRDDLTPWLDAVRKADVLILGSPVYYCSTTGMMRSFLERLIYPYYVYDEARSSLFPRKIQTALIISMNRTAEQAAELKYDEKFGEIAGFLKTVFGSSQLLQVYNTYQFDDYSKYYAPAFPRESKERQRREQYPADRRAAFELGKQLCTRPLDSEQGGPL